MDLGRLNMRHNVFPRVKEFNHEKLRQMISMCVAAGYNDEMCCVVVVCTIFSIIVYLFMLLG